MLAEEIRNDWATSAEGYAAIISGVGDEGYEAWAFNLDGSYGVAVPISPNVTVSEEFAGAVLVTGHLRLKEEERNVLMLRARSPSIKIPFSSLCAEFVNPGPNGEFRQELIESPTAWWMQWKELLGNKNVDKRVYDVLGELCTLYYLTTHGKYAEWNGPDGATYDIDCDGEFYEVKSTVVKSERKVTLSNLFQLDPPNGFPLYLVLCQFEVARAGLSINCLAEKLEKQGYSSADLNRKLEKLGLEKGKSDRDRKYIIHAMLKYTVDESFPCIRESSFIGGTLPKGVQSITYTVSLDGLNAENLLEKECKSE